MSILLKKLSNPVFQIICRDVNSGLGLLTFRPSGQSGNGLRIQGLENSRHTHTTSSLWDTDPNYVGIREAFPLA